MGYFTSRKISHDFIFWQMMEKPIYVYQYPLLNISLIRTDYFSAHIKQPDAHSF